MADWVREPEVVKEIDWRKYVDMDLPQFRRKSSIEVYRFLVGTNMPVWKLMGVMLPALTEHLEAKIQGAVYRAKSPAAAKVYEEVRQLKGDQSKREEL